MIVYESKTCKVNGPYRILGVISPVFATRGRALVKMTCRFDVQPNHLDPDYKENAKGITTENSVMLVKEPNPETNSLKSKISEHSDVLFLIFRLAL